MGEPIRASPACLPEMQKLSVGAAGKGTEAGQVNDLTKPERIQLEELETVIRNGQQTFVEVGNALIEIRDNKLYRSKHSTFEAYCADRWGFARRTAYQYIGAAEVVENVRNCAQRPATESQARPLTKLPAAEQPAAWQAATDKAQSEGRTVRARDVEEAVEERKDRTVDPMDGETRKAPKVAEVYTSETMVGLKRYWKQATKKERVAFIKWTETYEN
jgi:hypothetical protein